MAKYCNTNINIINNNDDENNSKDGEEGERGCVCVCMEEKNEK